MKTELGHYSVNGVSFGTNKVSAILEAQKTNSELKWYFFDDILNKVNWLSEPELSLDALYKMRAQQIRDKYDYLVVFLSGGADSSNVIRTFMNNNIHVDEVVAIIPEEGLKNFDSDDTDFSASNVMSEIKYAQHPILQEVYTKSPLTKITVVDFFDDIVNAESDAWLYQAEGDLVGMTGYRFGKLESVPHIKQLAEQGKRIASIWGTDKPILSIRPDGNIYLVIADTPVYLAKYPFDTYYNNVDRVLFYYSYELPEIMVKQAHVVAKEIYKPENQHIYKSIVDQSRRYVDSTVGEKTADQLINEIMQLSEDAMMYSPKTVYQRSIVPFIYPSTHDPKLFQTRKFDANRTFLTAYSDWIKELHDGSRLCQMITSDFTSFYKNISPKYLNPNRTGFNMCLKTFVIGTQQHFNSLTKGKK